MNPNISEAARRAAKAVLLPRTVCIPNFADEEEEAAWREDRLAAIIQAALDSARPAPKEGDSKIVAWLRKETREAKESASFWEKEHNRERAERQKEIGMQEYRGNTISYIYDKCKNYGGHFDRMRLEIEGYKEQIASLELRLVEKTREVEALKDWKASALAVEAEWDCQAVGRLLGVGLGQAVRPNIEPGIVSLRTRLQKAEELLGEAANLIPHRPDYADFFARIRTFLNQEKT